MATSLKDTPMTPTIKTQKADKKSRPALLAAIVGALVGALVSAGVLVAFREDSTTRVVRTTQVAAPAGTSSSALSEKVTVASVIDAAGPAVVAISVTTNSGEGAGTGFVITEDGYIVTNNHVIEDATSIEVSFTDGSIKSAKLVGADPGVDLAVLKVSGSGLPVVAIGDSDAVQVGDDVVAIGNALALEGGLSVTRGIISGTNRTVNTNTGSSLQGMLQTDAAVNPGNSGGPLLDANARVIGINTAIADPGSSQDVGFAIPISSANPIIADLRLGREPAFLGVSTQNVTAALDRELSLGLTSGAYVDKVTASSAAKDAGLKVGDVITKIDGSKITDSTDVLTAIRGNRPGETISITINRKGEEITVQAKLTGRPS